MNDWVIMNTKKKFTIKDAFQYMGYGTLFYVERSSNRGKVEKIWIYGAGIGYNIEKKVYPYIVDTGIGYGGRGTVKVLDILILHPNMLQNTSDIRLPLWVFK